MLNFQSNYRWKKSDNKEKIFPFKVALLSDFALTIYLMMTKMFNANLFPLILPRAKLLQ